MYTREDEDQARRLWKKRLGLALVPMIVGLAAGITLFVVGQMRRSDTLWMATAALTVLGGGAFLFLFGVWAKPRWTTCATSNACFMDASAKPWAC